ncbi:MAG: ATP-binding protein, partial [Chloroflexota bacterium]
MPEQPKSTQQPKSIEEMLARLHGRIEQAGFGDVVPEAEAPCETCSSKRFVTATDRTNPNAPARIVPCPTCRPAQLAEYKQRLYQSRLQRTRLPKKYQDVSLDDWGDPSHSSRQGKVTAFLAMWAMVNHPKHMVSSHAIAHDLRGIFGDVPDWVTAMLSESDDLRPGVALYGTYGVGKTWLAAAAMNELTNRGASVLYMRMSHLVQSLRDTWKSDE